jgi:cytochrome c oxidase cbb3-type subunit I/II
MADLERSIREGVAGTTMPGWSQFLSKDEIRDVARYLVVFSPRFAAASKAREEPKPLAMSPVPAEVALLSSHPTGQLYPCGAANGPEPSSLACRGEKLWNIFQCRWCHGDDRRGGGPTADGMKDEWGNPSRPADLTYKWLFKNGHEPKDVYRSVFGGLNGTAMQSYAAFVPEESDRWALVAYVLSLSPPNRPVLHLSEFATQRAVRIGANGRVVATSLPSLLATPKAKREPKTP